MAKTSTTTAPEKEATDPKVTLGKYLIANKEDHFNFLPDIDYKVSTGSLALDRELNQLGVGVHRFVGPPGSGKSSEAMEVARNFLATIPKSRVVYVKSEGRMSEEIQARSGLTFTKDFKTWDDGTVFVFECNIYETIIGLFRDLILNNESNTRYLFIVDSADAVNLKNDMTKDIGAEKVAGGPMLTKRFLQKFALAMAKYGHMCIYLGQISTEIKIDPYAKTPPRQVSGGGGLGVQHFANQVLEYQEWYEGDLILPDPEARVDRLKNRPLGHVVRVKIKKSDKENRYVTVEIPIRHNQVGGNSIWREREVGDEMLAWGLVSKSNPKAEKKEDAGKKGGSWLYFSEPLVAELTKEGITDLPEKVQGLNQLYDLLESRRDMTTYLFNKFRSMIETAK